MTLARQERLVPLKHGNCTLPSILEAGLVGIVGSEILPTPVELIHPIIKQERRWICDAPRSKT